jgi:hypothetical protein
MGSQYEQEEEVISGCDPKHGRSVSISTMAQTYLRADSISTCAAPIVRLPYLYLISHHDDFLWYAGPVAIWSFIEPGMGITAVSLATMRPLVHSFLARIGAASSNRDSTQRYKYSNHGNNNARSRSRVHSSSGGAGSTLQRAYIRHEGDLFEDDEEEELQLQGLKSTMGNMSRVEAAMQCAPIKKAPLDNDWPLKSPIEQKEGIRTTWVKGDSENNSTHISEEEITVTTTTHVSAWSAGNGPTKAFLV